MIHRNTRTTLALAIGCFALALGTWTAGCDSPPHEEDKDTKPPPRKKLDKPRGYLQTVVRSKTFAETQACLARMATLRQELVLYAQMNDGRFPPSLAALKRRNLIKTPMRGNEEYSYIAGQSTSSASGNILVYLEEVDHKGLCHVLRVGGTVEGISPDDLETELRRTRGRPKRR